MALCWNSSSPKRISIICIPTFTIFKKAQIQRFPRSRAALSLLGYCYYHLQDYELAADSYAKLVQLYPQVSQYRVYYSQSLLKAGEIDESKRAFEFGYNLNHDQQQHRTQRELMLQMCIKFNEGDLKGCRSLLNQCVEEDPETILAQATLCAKEGRYEDALELYSEAFNIQGFEAEIAYNIALCNYMMGEYHDALEAIQEIIDRATETYPEFSESNADEYNKVEVSNSITLQESFLIEAYNLKAAIEYDNKEIIKARRTLKQMPQRREEELDPVTLHNEGLMNIELDLNSGFEKLKFLLANPPFPPETFGNLLLLYCKFGHHEVSADILAENAHLTYDFLTEDLYDYLDTAIMAKASPDEALVKFENLARKYSTEMRKLANEFDSNLKSNNSVNTQSRASYESLKSYYIPMLMAQVNIYWQREEYSTVEKLFRQTADLCVDVDAWRLNVAHTFFVQGAKFKDAIKYYEPFVKEKSSGGILDVTPIVLANLCVCYIMTNQNEEAEDIMKIIEQEEEKQINAEHEVEIQKHHSCIINLVIGTLYCEKGNFEFGISRVCKSLEPLDKKLGADTWFYAKRCLLALADQVAKQMLHPRRETFKEVVEFLDEVDLHGSGLTAKLGDETTFLYKSQIDEAPSVSAEARQLKQLFLKFMD